MALSRDTRMDRRRRVLLDASAEQAENGIRKTSPTQAIGESTGKKSAGYSQDVRQACGTRLVQLIPVRRRSYTAVIVASIATTTILLAAHYLVYVNGMLPWYGNPLAVALDATHPHGIAAWLGSQIWLLCLVTTILTFQLRRHKLDDYKGEYRLWFWLVVTCIIASVDNTTHISDLFGKSLDRWSRVNIGWSGNAVVLATLATLIGMLGLRLCTELKSVPLSLVCWLIGLTSWAGSALLGQEMFRIDMAIQTRVWLRAALWLGGLTSIWIAALAYLRHVYIEAQRRFLARGRLARRANSVPLSERVRQSLPFMRRKSDGKDAEDGDEVTAEGEAKRWSLMRMFRRKPQEESETAQKSKGNRRSKAKLTNATSASGSSELPSTSERPRVETATNRPASAPLPNPATQAASSAQPQRPQAATAPLNVNSAKPQLSSQPQTVGSNASTNQTSSGNSNNNNNNNNNKTQAESSAGEQSKKRGWPFGFKLWPGKDVGEDQAPEFQKLLKQEQAEERRRLAEEKQKLREAEQAEKKAAKEARASQRAADKQAKRDAKQQSAQSGEKKPGLGSKLLKPISAVGGVFKKVKLPSLSAFKLSPPESEGEDASSPGSKPPSVPLPSTSKPGASSQRAGQNYQDEDDEEDDRHMSRADRKKNRRQNRAA